MYFQALDSKRLGPKGRLKLAIIGSPATTHLRTGLCASSVRRGFLVDTFVVSGEDYQELLDDDSSDLCVFAPDVILATVDAAQLQARAPCPVTWSHLAKQHLGASIIQRTILSSFPSIIEAERTYKSYPSTFFQRADSKLRALVDEANVRLVFPADGRQSEVLVTWTQPALWHRRKRAAGPKADLLHGSYFASLPAAIGGLSYSCLMLDVRNHSHLAEKCDLAALVADRYNVSNFRGLGEDGKAALDLVLLVDEDPFALKIRKRQSSVYSMPSHGRQ